MPAETQGNSPARRRAGLAALACLCLAAAFAPAQEPAPVYPTAAVAADHALASQAGLEMLRAGGNAVDAAVATSFALSVVRPYSCGIGGGGFMIIRLTDHQGRGPLTIAINFRETAPASVRPDTYESLGEFAATHGGMAVGIPGQVEGMLHALERYGTLSRERVLAPAIRLAREGFAADAHYIKSTQHDDLVIPWLRAEPSRQERFAWLWERCLKRGAVKVGDHVALPEQARVLERIAAEGRAGFYEGPVAEAIVQAVNADGGHFTLGDLRDYRCEEVPVLTSTFRGCTVIGMPPPSSGGIVIEQVLGMFEARPALLADAVKAGHNSPPYVHLVTEAGKHAFADRARWLGDSNFVKVPLGALRSKDYIASRAMMLDPTHTLPHEAYGSAKPLPEDGGTSHHCVIDAQGNAVACTETVNLIFGSLLAVPEFGFVLNNTMDDFLTRGGHANAFGLSHADRNRPEPGKRPLSSMTPTIVLDETGRPSIIVGGSGGPRIISGTLQTALNVLLFDMSADAALAASRFHHQWEPDVLQLEDSLDTPALRDALKAHGHTVGRREAVGNVQLIRRVPAGWQAASDPRKGGAPAGY
ncbi:MAG: gamma-glutamyltransferase [Leptolyngbya sp. PLA1]|nr:gamma-glutamyltransferase [Leptolyngbya sp. PLA1]